MCLFGTIYFTLDELDISLHLVGAYWTLKAYSRIHMVGAHLKGSLG